MTKCSNCEKKGEHWHHIVPKSRGGSDNPSNLILLCLDCHSKAHDVSFKGDGGLIKENIQRTREGWTIAAEWWKENLDTIVSFLDFLYDNDETLHDFFVLGMRLEYIRNDDVYKILNGENTRAHLVLNKRHKRTIRGLWVEFLGSGLEEDCEQA